MSKATSQAFSLPIPDSRFPIPDSLFPVPCSLFPVPCSEACSAIKLDYHKRHGKFLSST
ncbi:MAG: hypothetical protein F6J98_16645, partial [Moorea sp. SIO4G2]|nr:hypothetical protein [Moorena sp. SIO4G2]